MTPRTEKRRRGMAAAEMAILVPPFLFIGLITVDYARLLHASVEVTNAARDGALYASDTTFAATTGFASYQAAALADVSDLSPTPAVAQVSGVDLNGIGYVQVTVSYTFTTTLNYPGIPSTTTITKLARMAVAP